MMEREKLRRILGDMGMTQMFAENADFGTTSDEQMHKWIGLQALMREWVKSLLRESHLQFTPQSYHLRLEDIPVEEWIDDWLNEASEEWLIG